MLVNFDKLKRDYQENQMEIHAKLVSKMADCLAMHHQALQVIDWKIINSFSSDSNPYPGNLLKEVTTLHEDMKGMLLPNDIEALQKAQYFKEEDAINLEFIVDQGKIRTTKAKVDPGNVVMDSEEAQIQIDYKNIKFSSNHDDEKLKMKELCKI
ncbi:hypothetical protein O181_109882 [Austropuccinia psidii MF-1]|uniref:Uncharacterized protein n=1 Tax=Austropuccinia psidii MF-1 TaxID=1389203 RepID=A0A9Q3JYP8_9BASI|nr:hypothetical protein [Austropuccinia psidii MF-1]